MSLSAYHKKALFALHAEITARAAKPDTLVTAQLSALRKVLTTPDLQSRDDANKLRREKIARLISTRWPRLKGDCYQRAEQISEIGRKKGIWGSTTWCQQTILNHAVWFGFIPKDYYQLWKAKKEVV